MQSVPRQATDTGIVSTGQHRDEQYHCFQPHPLHPTCSHIAITSPLEITTQRPQLYVMFDRTSDNQQNIKSQKCNIKFLSVQLQAAVVSCMFVQDHVSQPVTETEHSTVYSIFSSSNSFLVSFHQVITTQQNIITVSHIFWHIPMFNYQTDNEKHIER